MDSNLFRAEQLGIKLEIAAGLPIWEASPVIFHQKAIDQIRATIKKSSETEKSCDCVHFTDIYVQFPDGSLKRPDISIFCEEPKETEEAVKSVPVAIIEVISKSYEAKDLELSPPIYLANGVKDVVVLNPYTKEVLHFRPNEETRKLTSPSNFNFECGCACTV